MCLAMLGMRFEPLKNKGGQRLRTLEGRLIDEHPFMEREVFQLVSYVRANRRRTEMKNVIVALSAAALIAATPAVMAKTHRHEMHLKKNYHGASARASEQQMQAKGSKTGSSGASNNASGQTTGSNTKPTGSNTKRSY